MKQEETLRKQCGSYKEVKQKSQVLKQFSFLSHQGFIEDLKKCAQWIKRMNTQREDVIKYISIKGW